MINFCLVLIASLISVPALAFDSGNLTVTLLSETTEGWYAQDNQTQDVGFLERNSDLVQSIRWTNCQPIANGTICEIDGRSKGFDIDEWNKWRSRNSSHQPQDPQARFRRPTPGNDPYDM